MNTKIWLWSACALFASPAWAQTDATEVESPKPVNPWTPSQGDPPAELDPASEAEPKPESETNTEESWQEQSGAKPPITPPQPDLTTTMKSQIEPRTLKPPILLDGHPRLFVAHTGHMLPASVIYVTSGLDTSGGFAADLRVGLGGVAEFGLEHYDQASWRSPDTNASGRVAPFFLASFKIGLPERLFFKHQPAFALGLRKSFQAEVEGYDVRSAEIFLVASKAITSRVRIHAGAVVDDGELKRTFDNNDQAVFFNEREKIKQFGLTAGLEFDILPGSTTIFEWSNAPEFVLAGERDPRPDDMSIQSQFLWGVRYRITDDVSIESGVRVRDIANAQIIDAQIFGKLTFVSDRLAKVIRGL